MIKSDSPRIDVPLVTVGCDFRSANVSFREQLVTTPEQRAALFQGIQAMDGTAGFASLETCNRVEWIVSTENPHWMAEVLAAQMQQRWQQAFPDLATHPAPRVFIGRKASLHLLRVVSGLESLAAGEAQIAGQFQDALLRARDEQMSSPVLNKLASHAGRLAKAGIKIGYRSDHRRGIHGMTAAYLKRLFAADPGPRKLIVAGMGSIGRKTAEILEQDATGEVIRVNRTVTAQHTGLWHPLTELADLTTGAAAVIVATGALEPVLDAASFNLVDRHRPLVVMDIGIPSQVTPAAQQLPGLDYRNLDDLTKADPAEDDQESLASPMEQEVLNESALFKRFCIERSIVTLLEETQQQRQQYILEQIPQIVENNLQEIDPEQRKLVVAAMRQLISEYANDSFQSIHNVLEEKWSEL